jgi:cell division protein FtsW (lipid II flippase)
MPDQYKVWYKRRLLERIFIIAIGAVLAFCFVRLHAVLQRDFADVPSRLNEGSIVNLNDTKPGERMQQMLQKGFYYEDPKDIALISSVVTQNLHNEETIDNIGELNKRKYDVNVEDAQLRGGDAFKKRAALSKSLVGFTGMDSLKYVEERTAPKNYPAVTNLAMGEYSIGGKILDQNEAPVHGALVRLNMLIPKDSMYNGDESDTSTAIVETKGNIVTTYIVDTTGKKELQSFTVYARTSTDGSFSFDRLPDGKAFNLLPLQPGFQFGRTQGVRSLEENVSVTFFQSPHRIRLFSGRDFNNLKKEKALIVRTPEEFNKWFWIITGVFLGGFLLLHIFITFRIPNLDQLVLPVVMILTGLSLLTLFSLQDPLRDRFLAQSTITYYGIGIGALFFMLLFNMRRFNNDSLLYRLFVFTKVRSAAKGWQWSIIAVGLLALTILFGTGPEGSGVKVNLFGFQPSEIVKFVIILFIGGFFASNEKFISQYSSWQKRWSFFYYALIAIGATILLFLMLGDLGPAMVCCFTFIILFSFSRGDFAQMIGAVVLYVASLWIIKDVWMATGVTALILIIYFRFIYKHISESSIMALVVMSGFLLIDKISILQKLFPGPVQRLIDRKAIWENNWNNEVFGGDQVANGIWAMASGGITGQGIGEGYAKSIPEAHTDMILPAMGEEFGWCGIVCIFILFLIYLHRSIIIGRQTGSSFLFYVCAGIGVGTFVQFLLIAGGSIGAIPLSGVSLPFISYGGSSLIANLVGAGFLLSASHVKGTEVQMQYITKQQDRNLVPALFAALIGIILLSVEASKYLFNNKNWVVQPALVADRSGARMFSYNPRIAILMNRLQAGTLYDRYGRILATSHPEQLREQRDSLLLAGLDPSQLDALSHKRLQRYYPFAEQTFFWTGDLNTGIFTGGLNGYFAEYEHLGDLRGFPSPVVGYTVKATRYREDPFLPETSTEMSVVKRDFSALSPLLLAGINSKAVQDFKAQNRDVKMTIDASLQMDLQKSFPTDDSLVNKRVSVVIIEDNTGDVIASANYPLPPIDDWEKMGLSPSEQNKLPYWLTNQDLGFTYASQPGSTAKLATALAAFNKLGPETAVKKKILVRPGDLIRTKSVEPDQAGYINIEMGIVRSNNPFFIRLANEEHLQEYMAEIYMQTGMFLRGVGGYSYERPTNNAAQQQKWLELWRKTEFASSKSYNINNIKRTRGRGISGMAWGQGELIATPAAVARLASSISNHGNMMPSKFVLSISDATISPKQAVPIAREQASAEYMRGFMIKQSAPKTEKLKIAVGGKTGTPERVLKNRHINDGWYVFFAPKKTGEGNIVVCIRVEDAKGSSQAVDLAAKHVIPRLLQLNYIKSLEKVNNKDSTAPKVVVAPAG